MNQLIGIKQNMTQAWDQAGKRLPLTLIKAQNLVVTQLKTEAIDGYSAVQIGLAVKKSSALTKPLKTHLDKSKLKNYPRYLREVQLDQTETLKLGATITLDQIFTVGDQVTVAGTTIGKGFAGAMKRHGFKGGPKTHGQSDRARAVGSIGQGTSPGRIHKGKRMPGHMGSQKFSVKHLTVAKIDPAKGEIWVTGAIPGPSGSLVQISLTGKSKFPGLRETVKA